MEIIKEHFAKERSNILTVRPPVHN